jgi:hypothetical protein
MNMAKRMVAVAGLGLVLAAAASAQTAAAAQPAAGNELSVEESYLQESVETLVIREQSRADSRDMKLIALEYINDAIAGGRVNDEIVKALDYMAVEGVVNKSREGGLGRVTNNFPDVRAKAAEYLGKVGGVAAKDTLIKMVLTDTEPMVLTEAIKALAAIGMNDNEEVATAISWIVTRFDILNPDNTMALAALNAYEQLAASNNGIKDPSTIRTIIRIAEGNYIRPVQAKARQVLSKLRQYGAKEAAAANK